MSGDLHFKKNAAGRVELIPDPTVKSKLPTNLLAAIGNTHVNLWFEVRALEDLLDMVGWPENGPKDSFNLTEVPESMSNALDYARENARLVWLILDLTSTLKHALGDMAWGDDGHGHPVLSSMG